MTNAMRWTVIPALPGTRLEWKADWCKTGTVIVHAWLIPLDIEVITVDDTDRLVDPDPYPSTVDTSSAIGYPMILNASGELQDARYADLQGEAGDVLEPADP